MCVLMSTSFFSLRQNAMNMCVLVGLLLIYSGFGKTLTIQEHLSVIVKEITELRIETGRLRNENKALNQEVDILKAMLNGQ